MTEEVPNPFLVLALGKLEIPIKDYKNHPKFQDLPEERDDPAWNDIKNDFDLVGLEFTALKNARCGTSSQPSQSGTY